MGTLGFGDIEFFYPKGCECCVRSTSYTSSQIIHKYTKDEIRARLVELATDLAAASWFNRGDIRRQIKHWAEKLTRFEEAEQDFDFKANP